MLRVGFLKFPKWIFIEYIFSSILSTSCFVWYMIFTPPMAFPWILKIKFWKGFISGMGGSLFVWNFSEMTKKIKKTTNYDMGKTKYIYVYFSPSEGYLRVLCSHWSDLVFTVWSDVYFTSEELCWRYMLLLCFVVVRPIIDFTDTFRVFLHGHWGKQEFAPVRVRYPKRITDYSYGFTKNYPR